MPVDWVLSAEVSDVSDPLVDVLSVTDPVVEEASVGSTEVVSVTSAVLEEGVVVGGVPSGSSESAVVGDVEDSEAVSITQHDNGMGVFESPQMREQADSPAPMHVMEDAQSRKLTSLVMEERMGSGLRASQRS